jgi:16S rRNA (cytosine1402-N4)-methyltransferase
VLLERCVELLAPALTARGADGSGAVLVDATVGAAGHSARLLSEFPGLRLISLNENFGILHNIEKAIYHFKITTQGY